MDWKGVKVLGTWAGGFKDGLAATADWLRGRGRIYKSHLFNV